MIETIEQANKILGPLGTNEMSRYELDKPFSYVHAGEHFIGVSDGRQATFIQSNVELPLTKIKFQEIFNKYNPGAGNTFSLKLTDLLEFAGEPVFDEPCKRCKGKGWYGRNGSMYCEDCDADGIKVADIRPGFFGPVQIDRNRLARSLSVVPQVNRCELTLPEDYVGEVGYKDTPVFIIGLGWWIILMPMRLSPDNESFPRFELNK